jgi:dimethylargininase
VSFTRAIVRPPGTSFAQGITTASLGMPLLPAALSQHASYCEALEECGLEVIVLDADARHPDSTFVEDTAVLTERVAVLARPGATSRRGEVARVADVLEDFYAEGIEIREPGTLDGGDVCQADDHFFIGVSQRTNAAGAGQLAEILRIHDYNASLVDIRDTTGLLHLKSGMSYVGERRLVLETGLASRAIFNDFDVVVVDPGERYAANCVRVNEHVLVAEGYPRLMDDLSARGYPVIPLKMSEFRKMDGGLSCLSLRF